IAFAQEDDEPWRSGYDEDDADTSDRETDPLLASAAAAAGAAAAARAATYNEVRPDRKPEPEFEPEDDDDPFAALEGALQREVDAVLKAESGGTDDTDDEEPVYADRAPRRGRGMMIAAAILGLVVFGGGAAIVYRSLTGGPEIGDEPPVITASGDALKERPADPGGSVVENQDAQIFDRANGDTNTDADAQIVPREETVTTVPAPTKSEDRVDTAALGAGSRDNPRVIESKPLEPDGGAIAPRRVRTMIVKADGTIVRASEDDAAAATDTAPQDQITADTPVDTPEPAPTQEAALPAATDQPAAQESAPQADAAPAADLNLGPEDPNIPLPIPRPRNISAAPRPAAQAAAPAPVREPVREAVREAAPAAAPAAAAPQPQANGAFLVQLASRRSQEQALSEFATLQSRYPNILGQYQPFIERADLGDRGVFYRLRVGPLGNQASAGQLCDQLKAAGLSDCLVRRN
ncbi:MAG: SPOR domain-containing protein, partial [Rhodobiaceae bacterium]|nr:SPOR domain-containing protein [Rhodobiaceae bacterium]